MPYKVIKKNGKRPWKIVNKKTGKIVGSSANITDAHKSIRARLAGENKKKRG